MRIPIVSISCLLALYQAQDAFSYVIFISVPFDRIVVVSRSSSGGSIIFITPILQMRKLNLRGVKSLAKGPPAQVAESECEPRPV